MNNNPLAGMMNGMIQKTMANNPLMAILNAARNGGNPMALMQQMAKSNPQMAQAMKMIDGKSPEQLKTIVTNMCAERNTTPQKVAKSLGINIPID